jgi:hypothetical protein
MSRYRIKTSETLYMSKIITHYTPQYKLWGLFWIKIYVFHNIQMQLPLMNMTLLVMLLKNII